MNSVHLARRQWQLEWETAHHQQIPKEEANVFIPSAVYLSQQALRSLCREVSQVSCSASSRSPTLSGDKPRRSSSILSHEKLKSESPIVNRTMIPMHHVPRIDQAAAAERPRITIAGSNVASFPAPIYTKKPLILPVWRRNIIGAQLPGQLQDPAGGTSAGQDPPRGHTRPGWPG